MPSATSSSQTPGLTSFLKSTKTNSIESSVELLVSLLQRRQIRNSRQCALATAQLLLRVVASERVRDAQALIKRVRGVGRRLVAAQPREMAVGNIVRRVLGIIREVGEESQNQGSADASDIGSPTGPSAVDHHRPALNSTISSFSPLHHISVMPANLHTRGESSGESTPMSQSISDLTTQDPLQQRPALAPASSTYVGSLFGLFQQPTGSAMSTPPQTGTSTPTRPGLSSPSRRGVANQPEEKLDVKAEVIDGIKELLDELEVVDSQIAESALDHIHSNEIILTHTSSQTVQRFLAAAARKRKFTVVVAEAYPNDHLATHETVVNGGRKVGGDEEEGDERWKPLTAQGITVILIPDSAVFALMSRINKVIIAPHTVLANGSLLAAAGSSSIALAARAHRVPVVVLSGIYKLSPVYPFDTAELIEVGDPSKVLPFTDSLRSSEAGGGELTVLNPVFDHVEAELVDLYITNLGGHAPSYLYRIVADHYRGEDVDLMGKE